MCPSSQNRIGFLPYENHGKNVTTLEIGPALIFLIKTKKNLPKKQGNCGYFFFKLDT